MKQEDFDLFDYRAIEIGEQVRDTVCRVLIFDKGKNEDSFLVTYRDKGGRKLKRHLCTGELDVINARLLARDWMYRVSTGNDPYLFGNKPVSDFSVENVGLAYLTEVLGERETVTFNKNLMKNHILTLLGKIDIRSLDYDQVLRFRNTFRDRPCMGNRIMSMLSCVIKFAECKGLRTMGTNPCRNIKRYPTKRRRRYATEPEMRRILKFLDSLPAKMYNHKLLMLTMIHTGARKSELIKATWNDLKGNRIELEKGKTGFRVVHIPKVLREMMWRPSKDRDSARIFKINRLDKFWTKLRREARVGDLRMHDLRHSFAARALSCNTPLEVIGKLMGHSGLGVTWHYTHLMEDYAQKSLERIKNAMPEEARP